MEQSVVTTRGIIIEKLTIGWLQLIIAAFSLGGITYLGMSVYTTTLEVKATQDANIRKYVPMIERLDKESLRYGETLSKLDGTLSTLNQNLAAITLLREREDKDRQDLKREVDNLKDKLTEIQIALGRKLNHDS